MAEDEERLDQPEVFELELELLRWVKKAVMETIPPIMQKPSGNAAQHYGLDSKSRWREAVCVMMILSDPAITAEGVSRLGRQMAQLFRQDYTLWDEKAKQLKNWVDRGLLNVKLLDRTLAYFQNQSSWLQYIKTLKKPIPKIESPGFPGTQWNEFYWKDQTVMLLMQEADFPDGKNPEFCAKLFKEEAGKWRLKMEQFKRWIEKGKNDPLPEYYGTGKNCAECGVFLWDTRSYLKHMKRNHGYKIKEKDKLMIKNDKRDKPEICDEDSFNADKFEEKENVIQPKSDKTISKSNDQKIHDSGSKDSYDSIFKGDKSNSNSLDNLLASESEKNESDLDVEKESSANVVKEKNRTEKKDVRIPKIDKTEVARFEPDNTVPLRRRAAQKPAITDTMVSCPECDFQCLHSKIVSHLKRCTKKAAQAKKKAAIQAGISTSTTSPKAKQEKINILKEKACDEMEKRHDISADSDIKKHKESDIVKKVFLKKFEAQKNLERKNSSYDGFSDDSNSPRDITGENPTMKDKDLLTKNKKDENAADAQNSQNDITGKKLQSENIKSSPKEEKKIPSKGKKKSLSNVINELGNHSRKITSNEQEDSSEEEVIPQKSNRLKTQSINQEYMAGVNTENKSPTKSPKFYETKKSENVNISNKSDSDDIVRKNTQVTKHAQLTADRKRTKYEDVSETNNSHKEVVKKSPVMVEKELFKRDKMQKTNYHEFSIDSFLPKKKLDILKIVSPTKPEQIQTKYDDISDDSFSHNEDVGKSPPWNEKQPPLKLKLSRKDVSSEISHFEVSEQKNDTIDAIFGRSLAMQKSISDRSNQPRIMLENINVHSKSKYEENLESNKNFISNDENNALTGASNDQLERITKYDDYSSEEEVMPQRSRRSKGQITKKERKNTDKQEQSDKSVSKFKDDTSEEEIMPQKSRRSKDQFNKPERNNDDEQEQSEKNISTLKDDTSEEEIMPQKSRRSKDQVTKEETEVVDKQEALDKHISELIGDTSEEEIMPQKSRRTKCQPKKKDNKLICDSSTLSPSKSFNDPLITSSKQKYESSDDEMLSTKLSRQKLKVTKQETKMISNKQNKAQSKSMNIIDAIEKKSMKKSSQYDEDFSDEEDMPIRLKKSNEEQRKGESQFDLDPERQIEYNGKSNRKRTSLPEIITSRDRSALKPKDESSEEEVLPQLSKRFKGQLSRKEMESHNDSKQTKPPFELPSEDNSSKVIDSSTGEEIFSQKKKRFKGFLESFKPVPETELTHLKDKKQEETDKMQENTVSVSAKKNNYENKSQDEKENMKNKWLQSLEKRNKGKSLSHELPLPKPSKASIEIDKALDISQSDNEKNSANNQISNLEEGIGGDTFKQFKKQDAISDPPASESLNSSNKTDLKSTKKSDYGSFESVEYHEGRPSLRRGKMIPCPLCGAEYAIASNLQKHIDKEHTEGDDRSNNKRKSKEKTDVGRKKKKVNDNTDSNASDIFGDPSPGPSGTKIEKPTRRSDEFDNILAKSRVSDKEVDLDAPPNNEKESGEDKLTEYEIFQKLQLKEPSKTGKKKIECKECGLYLPTNTIKRHLLKHEKNAIKTQALLDNATSEKETTDEKVPCTECDKIFPPNSIKKHMAKHKRDKKNNESVKDKESQENEEFSDERIPCQQCGKMLPKNAMKRHLMKHETVSQESDSERNIVRKTEEENSIEDGDDDKPNKRKKVTCVECGLQCAPNVIKRHLEKHAKMKSMEKSVTQNDIYAPIEITPTKEYWEYEKEKGNKSDDKTSEEYSHEDDTSHKKEDKLSAQYKRSKEEKKDRAKSRKETNEIEPVNKSVRDLKESEKAKNSEEESESENPLETAVRKVVSYRMTPKQALSNYNLTPKVLFDNLLGETDMDRMSILNKVNLSSSGEKKVINYCKQNEAQLSYKAVINCVRDLKVKDGFPEFSLSRLEAYRWWYAFRKKFDLKITAKKK